MDLIGHLAGDKSVQRLASLLNDGRHVAASGAIGSSTALVAAAGARLTNRPVVLVVAHLDEAQDACDDLSAAGIEVIHLPALEVLPGETDASPDLLAERLEATRGVRALGERAGVIVCPVQALMQAVPAPDRMDTLARTVVPGHSIDPAELIRWLAEAGYSRVDAIEEPGDFAIRGGIVDVFVPGGSGTPVRLDFFGDEVDRIAEIDLETMGSDRRVDRVDLLTARAPETPGSDSLVSFLELVPARAVVLLGETMEITEQARGYYERLTEPDGVFGPPEVLRLIQRRFRAVAEINQYSTPSTDSLESIDLPITPLPTFDTEVSEAVAELARLSDGSRVVVACHNDAERRRLGELLDAVDSSAGPRAGTKPKRAERGGAIESILARVSGGFIWEHSGTDRANPTRKRRATVDESPRALAIVPYNELLHRVEPRRRSAARLRPARAMDTFLDLREGDFVVHTEHGIARFAGLTSIDPGRGRRGRRRPAGEPEQEYLTLEFANRARLHVPATQIDLVQKYIGGFSGKPPLSVMGGQRWKAQTRRVTESVRDLASELLRVRATRDHTPGVRFAADTDWQREFEAEFPFQETDDQLAALGEIKKDMQSDRPMDRLLCGDVGFGKTELAIRAAFKAVEFGRQVAVLVPTTVLAEQHERTFRSRFADYPFRVESLSRFKTDAQVHAILDDVRKGHVDVVIGTHRLLSGDVRFADLGLVIVDEEQRFGVEHKQRLVQLRLTADVLTLSATPIPRTLHMAILGLRDISSLAVAPPDRHAVVTEVIPYNPRRLRQVILREISRDGQVYFVHNRVHNIHSIADDVRAMVPEAKIVVGHGRMRAHELERVMLAFMRREADVLVSTTIIESGLDIPNANTIIIMDADRFGLADLHQLRGRVGRSPRRAYCYLLLPLERTITDVAKKRLKAVERYNMLGAGFKIAMRDLEIRGAGNLLGPEQSGHIAAVGYEMYCRLLERAVQTLRGEPDRPPPSATTIDVGFQGSIPRAWIPSTTRRLDAYRRIACAADIDDLSELERDMTQAYGSPPRAVRRLLDLAQLRLLAAGLEVRAIVVREGKDVVFRTPAPDRIVAALDGAPGKVTPLPPKRNERLAEVYYRPPPAYMEPESLVNVLRKRLAGPPSGTSARSRIDQPATEATPCLPSES